MGDYLQAVISYIQKGVLKAKRTEFRKWPCRKGEEIIPATEFDLWDEDMESVLPRQSYFGKNTRFALNCLGVRLVLAMPRG